MHFIVVEFAFAFLVDYKMLILDEYMFPIPASSRFIKITILSQYMSEYELTAKALCSIFKTPGEITL